MKKVERYVYITLIIILVGVLASGTTYIIMKNNDKTEIKENNNNQNDNNKEQDNNQSEESKDKEDGVKLLKTYNLNDKIIEEYEITLNGKKNNIKVEFTYDENKYETSNTHTVSIVKGTLNNSTVISYHDYDAQKNSLFNTTKVKEKFNENNFKIIRGADNKSYLLLATDISSDIMSESHLLVFNDNLEQIKGEFEGYSGSCSKDENMVIATTKVGYKLKNGTTPYYKNSFNINISNYQLASINIKIENNKIYYLVPIFSENSSEGILEEREYTLNNNKFEYKVVNSYKELVPYAGQMC